MRVKLQIVASSLLLVVFSIAGCSLVSSPEDDTTPQSEAPNPDSGTIVIAPQTIPPGQPGTFTFTGVPTGTVSTDGTLVVSNLTPGTYTSTEINPAPDFDLTAVDCDDGGSATPSSGDASTRTAVINVDPGETVQCTFTNTQRGTLVIANQTAPDGAGGSFLYTGVPTGTVSANGTLVVANLTPGTYTSTERDPAPDFDVTNVECDDGGSPTPSAGDASTRTAIFNLDPGEMVTCTFTNTRRGTLVVASQTVPDGAAGSFQFTGVPTGTVSANGTLVAANLTPGTYTSTERDPAPDFELTDVDCDDGGSATPSSGDASTRSAIFNLDPGETVTCTFTNIQPGAVVTPTITAGNTLPGTTPTAGDETDDGLNPFEYPDDAMEDFPLPEELPPKAGTYPAPKAGPWSVTHFAGQMSCSDFALAIPASPPENGVLEVQDGGTTVIGSGLQGALGVSITMHADPEITGRYTGSFQGIEQGVPVTIQYFWQVVTDEYMVGFLTASFTSEGDTCSVYRSFEMVYTG